MSNKELTLGADPEAFLKKIKENSFIPSLGIIQGTKELPFEIIGPGFSIQVDNAMAEYNIPPSNTPEEFSSNIQKVLDWFKKHLPENIAVVITPSAEFDKDLLDNEHCQLLGCSADYDVYSGENTSVTSLSQTNWRFAGGHIHVGYPNPNIGTNEKIVKWMDVYLGLTSTILDDDDKRKMYYGTPGRYRDTSFGVEYRTLSNYWTAHDKLRQWVFRQTEKAYYAVVNKVQIGESYEREIQSAIATNNRNAIEKLMDHFDVISNKEFNELLNLKVQLNAEIAG